MDAHPAGMMGHSWAWVWGIRDTSFPVPALRVYPFKSGGIARRTPALRVSRCMHIQRLEGEFFSRSQPSLVRYRGVGGFGRRSDPVRAPRPLVVACFRSSEPSLARSGSLRECT